MTHLNTKNGWEYWGVEVPPSAIDPWVINNNSLSVGVNWFDTEYSFGDEGLVLSDGCDLPPGHWEIHCDQNPTEEQAGEVVGWFSCIDEDGNHWGWLYRDYMDATQIIASEYNLDTAIESLNSLKKAKGLGNCIILKKKV